MSWLLRAVSVAEIAFGGIPSPRGWAVECDTESDAVVTRGFVDAAARVGGAVPDEVTLAIATALASRGAEAIVAGGRGAMTALYRLVRKRFASEPPGGETDGSAALAAAVAQPANVDSQVALASFLAVLMARDAAFDAAIRAHWQAASGEISADRGGVVNHFSGYADKVVQARDVRGDITF